MKNVMLAAYYFPPMASVSWMRVTKFAKYLPRMGWNPTVVTVDGRYYPRSVEGAMPPEVASLQIRRFGYRPWLPVTLVKLLYPLYVLWNAIKHRHSLNAVVMFGSPFHPFLIAPAVRAFAGLPVVLDLRDGWSTWHEEPDNGSLTVGTNLVRRTVETIGFRNACAAVFATEILRRQYAQRFPCWRHKFVTVSNGFDPDDFKSVETMEDGDQSTMLIAGKFLFYTPQVARWLFELLPEHPGWRFVYIGEEAEEVESLAKKVNAESQVAVKGYLPYPDVLREIGCAKLCVTANSFSEGLGTKLFDYLALRKRMLCFVPSVSEIAEQFEGVSGVTVCREPHTREGVAEGLRRALGSGEVGGSSVSGFTRQEKAAELAHILDSCVADGRVGDK